MRDGRIRSYYVKTGTNIWDIMDVVPDDEDRTIDEELQNKQFGKVYIMLGVNELGTGTAETYYQQFKKVVRVSGNFSRMR